MSEYERGYLAGIKAAAQVADKARRRQLRLSRQHIEKTSAARDHEYCLAEIAHVRDDIRELVVNARHKASK